MPKENEIQTGVLDTPAETVNTDILQDLKAQIAHLNDVVEKQNALIDKYDLREKSGAPVVIVNSLNYRINVGGNFIFDGIEYSQGDLVKSEDLLNKLVEKGSSIITQIDSNGKEVFKK